MGIVVGALYVAVYGCAFAVLTLGTETPFAHALWHAAWMTAVVVAVVAGIVRARSH